MFADHFILTLLFPSKKTLHAKSPVTDKRLSESEEALLPYKELDITKLLSKAKFPVYLAQSKVNKQLYALKMFPLENDVPHQSFVNEKRFAFLNHPNVVKIKHIEHQRNTKNRERISYILMEYAPYGDFFDLIVKIKMQNYDKLIRTYFRQLIQGVEYLHDQGVVHLDLKLENILLGEDYILKIADFDLACMAGDKHIISEGTKFYRAPEVSKGVCTNCEAADIYSAGIILFLMKSGCIRPHCEDSISNGVNFYQLLKHSNENFWEEHSKVQGGDFDQRFTPEVKELFIGMTKHYPQERMTIKEIKASKWYQGEVYTDEELKRFMEDRLQATSS